jgi:hypothetical protein
MSLENAIPPTMARKFDAEFFVTVAPANVGIVGVIADLPHQMLYRLSK